MEEEVKECIPGMSRRGDDDEDGNVSMIDDNPGLQWSGTQFKKSNTSLQTTGLIANHIMDKVIANHIMDRVIARYLTHLYHYKGKEVKLRWKYGKLPEQGLVCMQPRQARGNQENRAATFLR